MPNLLITISYDGTPFHGWAWQPEVPTVEGFVQRALATILNRDERDLDLQGASRTDAGVHALGQRASFSYVEDREILAITKGLNGLTPDSIRIDSAREVPAGFNARHDSRGKHYRFRIWNERYPHPLLLTRTWHVPPPLDADLMAEAGQHLVGKYDFNAFRAADCQALTSERELTRVDVARHGSEVVIDVEGTAFLKYMVRIIVGTLVEVGRGKWRPERVRDVRESGDRRLAGPTAQPQGLTLLEVFYDLDA